MKFCFPLLFCSVLIFTGCKKDDKEEPDRDIGSASDNALAEVTFSDIGNIVEQAAVNDSLTTYRVSFQSGILSSCATVSNDMSVTPHVLTIDFGNVNCKCADDKNRRGKILVSYTGQYRDSGSTYTVSFNNYFVNDFKVSGNKTVVNSGRNNSGNLSFSINVNGIITNTSGQELIWNSVRTREWTAGESTSGILGWLDDEYKISGSASGVSFEGTPYTVSISNPLLVALNCRWIKQGVLVFTPGNLPARVLDYGNGNCDNDATVTVSGYVFNIKL